MVHKATIQRILDMRAEGSTVEETAEALGVSVSTVMRVWKDRDDEDAILMANGKAPTNSPPVIEDVIPEDDGPVPDPADGIRRTDYGTVLAEYLEVLRTIRSERVRYQRMADANPDNCAWGNLVLKTIDAEARTLRDIKEMLGLGRVVYIGADGYTYSKNEIEGWVDRDMSPRAEKEAQRRAETDRRINRVLGLDDDFDFRARGPGRGDGRHGDGKTKQAPASGARAIVCARA